MSGVYLTRSLREPGGPCTKSMEVSECRMERVNLVILQLAQWICWYANKSTILGIATKMSALIMHLDALFWSAGCSGYEIQHYSPVVWKFLYHIQEWINLWQFWCLRVETSSLDADWQIDVSRQFTIAGCCWFSDCCVVDSRQMVCAPIPIDGRLIIGSASDKDGFTKTVTDNLFVDVM